MRYLKPIQRHQPIEEDDPMAGVAQLFDVSIAFIVAIIAALFALLSSTDLLNKDSEWTLMRKTKDGQTEIVEKRNNQVITHKTSTKNLSGNGVRLGTAYQLENGQVIYVPDTATK